MKKLKVPFFLLIFYYWSWGHKILPGTLVRIPIWIRPCFTTCDFSGCVELAHYDDELINTLTNDFLFWTYSWFLTTLLGLNSDWIDYCIQIEEFLSILYTAPPVEYTLPEYFACEGESLTLECKTGSIKVISAAYGRKVCGFVILQTLWAFESNLYLSKLKNCNTLFSSQLLKIIKLFSFRTHSQLWH